ncbi:MAG: iron uptake transporter deferrochelatase/peroxidase subunit [Solirubrobacteraceae bacterium]
MDEQNRTEHTGVTRRRVLSGAALVGLGAGADRLLGGFGGRPSSKSLSSEANESWVPFYGAHQAGIATPAQEYLHFAAFDVTSGAPEALRSLLQEWTAAAASLTAGEPYQSATRPEPGQAPIETGEAVGLGPSRLTLTFGFGPSLFSSARLGLAGRRPQELAPLPAFQGDNLEAARSEGDLCVQACAEDPQVAFHAIHVLSRIANGTAVLRWAQPGFGRTSSTSTAQTTPRNLMGFKDGTDNIRAEQTDAMRDYVWVQEKDGPSWMVDGSYLIARRIRIIFDVWDATTLEGQQRVIGRDKLTGAPLGERSEYDPVDLNAMSNGEQVIPANAHIRLANPANNNGQRILRRGYSYSEGVEPESGEIDAGLFFIAFQRSPTRQFILLQRRLASSDALNHHTLHTSSAIFAIPPGVDSPGGFIGEGLFAG